MGYYLPKTSITSQNYHHRMLTVNQSNFFIEGPYKITLPRIVADERKQTKLKKLRNTKKRQEKIKEKNDVYFTKGKRINMKV